MTISTITALPTAPARTDAPATFISRADAFLAALVTMQGELNTSIGQMNTDIAGVNTDATAAAASATAAAASAAAADASSNATLWVSGTSYSSGDVVYSPITYVSYRANTATSGTTDPSLSADWTPLSVDLPDQTGNSGKYLTTDGSNSSWNLIAVSDVSDLTATASELNKLDGVTATTTELNYVDIDTLGQSQASKAVTADANGFVDVRGKFRAKEQYLETKRNYGSVSGAVTVDCSDANYHEMTLTGNVTFTFSNPEDGSAFVLKLLSTTGDTITWPAAVEWPDGTAPTVSGDCLFTFITPNSGTAWFGFLSGKDIA